MDADEKAIIDLNIAYTWALDTRQFEALRDVFTPEATGMLRGVQCDGIDAIIARIQRPLASLDASQHIVSNHQVRVDGDTATCRCYVFAQHVRGGTPGGDNFIVAGIYDDRLERRAEGWRIVHRTMAQLWQDGNPEVVRGPAPARQ